MDIWHSLYNMTNEWLNSYLSYGCGALYKHNLRLLSSFLRCRQKCFKIPFYFFNEFYGFLTLFIWKLDTFFQLIIRSLPLIDSIFRTDVEGRSMDFFKALDTVSQSELEKLSDHLPQNSSRIYKVHS